MGVQEREERERGMGKLFEELRAENIPNLGKKTVHQTQEVQRTWKKMNPRRPNNKTHCN